MPPRISESKEPGAAVGQAVALLPGLMGPESIMQERVASPSALVESEVIIGQEPVIPPHGSEEPGAAVGQAVALL